MKIFESLDEYYRVHSKFYDITRWSFLFGRSSLSSFLPGLPENPTILDLGCGTGKQLKYLKQLYPGSRITGIDLSEDMLQKASKKFGDEFELVNARYSKERFPENTFDLISASYSLTMMDDLHETIEAIKYHLKPEAYIAAVDFDSSPFPWFMDWMKINHVEMKDNLFNNLARYFPENEFRPRKAYFGLYSYSFFLGLNNSN